MHGQRHPEPEQLDRLRAGLLDEQPETRALLEQHLAGCELCRARSDWSALRPRVLGPDLDPAAVQRSLRGRRSQAMRAPARQRRQGLAPYASAALLLVAVSLGIWTLQPDRDGGPQLAQHTQAIPDIYEDLDFYLWLANQEGNGNGDENGDPNNT